MLILCFSVNLQHQKARKTFKEKWEMWSDKLQPVLPSFPFLRSDVSVIQFFSVWGQCIVLFVKIMVIFNCNQLFVCLLFLFFFSGAFDLLAYTNRDQEIPETWEESQARIIANSQEVRLRSFSTSVHKVDTMVSYKGEDWCKQDDIACPAHNSCTKVHVWKGVHTHSTRILFYFIKLQVPQEVRPSMTSITL